GTKDTTSPSTDRGSAAATNGTAAGVVTADLINKSAPQQPVPPDVPSASRDNDWDALPPTPSASSSQTNAPSVNFAPDTTPPPTLPSSPDAPDPTVGAGPSIIELPASPRVPHSQSTAKQPAMGTASGATSAVQPSAIPQPDTTSQRRNTGK